MVENLEDKIIELIQRKGPQTGAEIRTALNEDHLILWQTCVRSERLAKMQVGVRYLRLDPRLDGYACLSPSILREFQSYTVLGLQEDPESIQKRAQEIAFHIEMVSQKKLELAKNIVAHIRQQVAGQWDDSLEMCFILAGDIVYKMAHDVPRAEQSTGKFVNGSDIDLVIVLEERVSDDLIKRLDDAIYGEKYRTLTFPHLREEIDYVIKRVSRMQEQLQFDTFKRMVACKILNEGCLLDGSERLFAELKAMLTTHGIDEQLRNLEKRAALFRKKAEEYLLYANPDLAKKESLYLFYPHEESEEFE